MSAKSIAVIGGGIGGVSAALNLLRAGLTCMSTNSRARYAKSALAST